MSDTITAWHDMQEEQERIREVLRQDVSKYIFLLDFNDGKCIDMTLALYVMSIMLGIQTQNLVKHFYMAQVIK